MDVEVVTKKVDIELTASCMNHNTLLKYLRRHYGDISSIFDGFEVSEEYIADPNNWISLGTGNRLFSRIKEFTGNQDPRLFFDIGREIVSLESVGILEQILRLFPNPRIVVGRITEFNRKFNNLFEMYVYDLKSRSAKLDIKWRDDFREDYIYEQCPWSLGLIAAIPHIWKLPDMEIIEEQCIFRLDEIVDDAYGYLGINSNFDTGRFYVDGEEYAKEVFGEDGSSLGFKATRDLVVRDTLVLTEGVIYGAPHCTVELHWEKKSFLRNLYDLTIGRRKLKRAAEKALEEQLDYTRQQFFEIQRLNEELTEYSKTLEQKVQERTTQLLQQSKLAAMGRLAAQISHETKTPLQATRDELELLRDEYLYLVFQFQDVDRLGLDESLKTKLYDLMELVFARSAEVEYRNRSTIESLAETLYENLKGKYKGITITACEDLAAMGYENDVSELDQLLQTDNPAELTGILRRVFNVGFAIHNGIRASDRQMKIVNALLEHAHIDRREIEAVDINEKISATLTLFDKAMRDAGIKVETDFDEGLGLVECNVVRMNDVYRNLIENALDALKESEGEKTLRIKTQKDGDWAIVEITDTGPGIPEGDIDKIFEPMYTTKKVGEGTGLGLNIVYNTMKEHKGDVQCISRPGETTFQLRLPIKYQGKA